MLSPCTSKAMASSGTGKGTSTSASPSGGTCPCSGVDLRAGANNAHHLDDIALFEGSFARQQPGRRDLEGTRVFRRVLDGHGRLPVLVRCIRRGYPAEP